MKRIITILLLSISCFAQTGGGAVLGGGAHTSNVGSASANTFSLVKQNTLCFWSGISNACSVQSTGSGNLLEIACWESSSGAHFLSSVSGGGTWVVPTGANSCQLGGGPGSVSCGYALSSSSGVTTITPTMSASDNWHCTITEVSYTPGPITVDAQNSTSNGAQTNPPGQTLTLTGTNDACFQEINDAGGGVTGISAPYANFLNGGAGNFDGYADWLSATAGTAPTWTDTNNSASLVGGICFK